jgi:hypothetical protein
MIGSTATTYSNSITITGEHLKYEDAGQYPDLLTPWVDCSEIPKVFACVGIIPMD